MIKQLQSLLSKGIDLFYPEETPQVSNWWKIFLFYGILIGMLLIIWYFDGFK